MKKKKYNNIKYNELLTGFFSVVKAKCYNCKNS